MADIENLSDLEKEGAVQRFEFTVELARKTLKDYLEHSGVALAQITPKNVVKQAFGAKIIRDGQLWIDMLDCRNLMSHNYDEKILNQAVRKMSGFLPALNELHEFLKSRTAP